MQLMKEGAKWELYIPSELGYGDSGAGGAIPGGAVLVFTLELLKVRMEWKDHAMFFHWNGNGRALGIASFEFLPLNDVCFFFFALSQVKGDYVKEDL